MMTDLWMPAQSLDAERALLGGVLLDNSAFDDVSDVISAEHFYNTGNERIWTTMSGLLRQGRNVDAVELAEDLQTRGWLGECGGAAYIAVLMESVPHSAHSRRYAEIVREKADRRNARYSLQEAVQAIDANDGTITDVIHRVDGKLMTVLESSVGSQDIHVAGAVSETLVEIDRRINSDGDVSGLASGFVDLDRLTTGFYPATLVVLAARPSVGKTALVGNIAFNVASAGKPVLFFSLEQSRTELTERLIASAGNVDARSLKTGQLNSQEKDRVQRAAAHIGGLPLFIDDGPGQTMQHIRAVARRTQRKHSLAMVIVDYLQIVTPEIRTAYREQQVADISRKLKDLAKELKVPVIALAQLNREIENREDKRPRPSDIRESGSIENDADGVMFLHRPEKYDAADRPGVAELILSKHRNGETGIVELAWQGKFMRFIGKEEKPIEYQFASDGRR